MRRSKRNASLSLVSLYVSLTCRSRLKNASPAKQEQARLEVENAEDDLVQKTEVAITLMKTVLDNVCHVISVYFLLLIIQKLFSLNQSRISTSSSKLNFSTLALLQKLFPPFRARLRTSVLLRRVNTGEEFFFVAGLLNLMTSVPW